MKQVTCKLYKFEELSDEVREKLVEKNRFDVGYDMMDGPNDEYECTLIAFEKLFGCKVHYEVSYCGSNWWVEDFYPIGEYCNEISAKEIKGKYVLRVINSFYDDIFPRKLYWGKFKWDENGKPLTRKRYSNITRSYEGCPLTGVCYDFAILKPIFDYLKKPNWDLSLKELVEECLRAFFYEWRKEYEYYCDNTENCIEEELSERWSNEMFFEDGKMFDGIYEVVV